MTGRHKSAINALIALKRVRISILAAPYMSKNFYTNSDGSLYT